MTTRTGRIRYRTAANPVALIESKAEPRLKLADHVLVTGGAGRVKPACGSGERTVALRRRRPAGLHVQPVKHEQSHGRLLYSRIEEFINCSDLVRLAWGVEVK